MVRTDKVWKAIENLNELGFSDSDLFLDLAKWIGTAELKEWLEEGMERVYDFDIDDDGNVDIHEDL